MAKFPVPRALMLGLAEAGETSDSVTGSGSLDVRRYGRVLKARRIAFFVAYYASAELGCFLSLGWDLPVRILDLFTEFRNFTNGWPTLAGNSLLGALAHFGSTQ